MRPVHLLAIVAALGVLAAPVRGQETAPKPGQEVQNLATLVGNWTLEGDVKPGLIGPGGKFTGTSRAEWMQGGYFVIAHEHYTGAVGDGDSISITGYDKERGAYTYYGFNSGGDTEISTGHNEANRWVWTHPTKTKGQAATIRYTVVFTSPSSYEFHSEISTDGVAWTLFLEGKAHKGS
jgi:hypothetical protein